MYGAYDFGYYYREPKRRTVVSALSYVTGSHAAKVGIQYGFGYFLRTRQLPADVSAQFFPRKKRFYYDPERMTFLDMLHEAKHLELFERRGNWRISRLFRF